MNDLITASINLGGLSQDDIARIIQFRVFGNRRGFLLLENMPIGAVPDTPLSRDSINKKDVRSEMLLLQATALLGDPIGYIQESEGSLINNFFPHPSQARKMSSDSFDTELDLHTENAFHAVQPDYLVLLCLRQDPGEEAVTYVASIDNILDKLEPADIHYFAHEQYNFLSDYCKREKNCRIDINKRQPVLYGDIAAPYFRFDPYFMVASSHQAQTKLAMLRDLAWQAAEPLRLRAGNLLIIDNRKTAHARSAFSARFDGTDRWIQRTFAVCNRRFLVEKLGTRSQVFELVANL
nr:TauD/TfdA family dioxygenase [Stutzerimonas azotifigens]